MCFEGKTLSVIKTPFAKTHYEFMPKKISPERFFLGAFAYFFYSKNPHHQKAKSDENQRDTKD